MTRSRPPVDKSEKPENRVSRKRYRFELGTVQLIMYCLGLVLVLSWIFTLGVLVGRGIPLVSSNDVSMRAQFLRFLGLGKEAPPPPQNAAQTWEDPEKMLQSLSYYDDLTRKNGSSNSLAKPKPQRPDSTPKASSNIAIAPNSQSVVSPSSTSQGVQPSSQSVQRPGSALPQGPGQPETVGERYTLLVSSLKEVENARHLMEELRSKGYSPRLDSLDLSESGRWNRVLVGSFGSREEAQRFAAEFNRKEHMEGLVIRELR